MTNLFSNNQNLGGQQQTSLLGGGQQQTNLFGAPQGQQGNLFSSNQNQLFQQPQQQQQSLFSGGSNFTFQKPQQTQLFQQSGLQQQPLQQINQQSQQQQAFQNQQLSQQSIDLNNMILVFQGYNTKQFNQQDRQLLQKTYSQRFNLAFGNQWQNKSVKDINQINNAVFQKTTDVTDQLDKNQQIYQSIKTEKQDFEKKTTLLLNNIYLFSQEALVIKIQLKRAKVILDDVQSQLSSYQQLEQEFILFTTCMKQNRASPLIQIPSQFMLRTHEKVIQKMNNLYNKLKEIEDIIEFNYNKESAPNSEFEMMIKLIQELYTYYQYVSCQVLKLYDNIENFKQFMSEFMRDQFQIDLRQKINLELQTIYESEEQIKKLAFISHQIEEKRKMLDNQKIQEQENVQIQQGIF